MLCVQLPHPDQCTRFHVPLLLLFAVYELKNKTIAFYHKAKIVML